MHLYLLAAAASVGGAAASGGGTWNVLSWKYKVTLLISACGSIETIYEE